MRLAIRIMGCIFTSPLLADCNNYQGALIPDASIPVLADTGSNIEDFIPPGWKLAESVTDDFNHDQLIDVSLALVENNPKNLIKNDCGWGAPEFDSNPYVVVVALKQKDKTYKRVASDFKIIPRLDDPVLEQPYDSITAKSGILSVDYHFWQSAGSWSASTHSYKFRFQEGCMRLIGHEYGWRHRASGEETLISTNFLTGMYLTVNSNPENNQRLEKKARLKNNPKYCLGDVPATFEHIN